MTEAKIFVGGLPPPATADDLTAYFDAYGAIVHSEVMMDRKLGHSRCFGFVIFSDPASVDLCIEHHDMHVIMGKKVDVKVCLEKGAAPAAKVKGRGKGQERPPMQMPAMKHDYMPAPHRMSVPSPVIDYNAPRPRAANRRANIGSSVSERTNPLLKLFVGGLLKEVTKEDLREYFEQFGPVTSTEVKTNAEGLSRGFGFVIFESEITVRAVLDAKKSHTLGGKWIEVKQTDRCADAPLPKSTTKIFLGGLSRTTTSDDIVSYFSQFGPIESCEVKVGADNVPRGFGFVVFENVDSVRQVMADNKHKIDDKWVEVKEAVPGRAPSARPVRQESRPSPLSMAPVRHAYQPSHGAGYHADSYHHPVPEVYHQHQPDPREEQARFAEYEAQVAERIGREVLARMGGIAGYDPEMVPSAYPPPRAQSQRYRPY